MLKKIILAALGIFLMLTLINIFIGIVFWLKNINTKPMEAYVDAPYIYYQRENKNQFQNGFDISPAVNKTKNRNEVRILMLGGSVANSLMNLSVKDGSPSWGNDPVYLEALLQKHFEGIEITLLNGANPAYVSEQEFIAFQMHLQYYQPDIIIGVHGFNDVESFRMNHLVDDPDFIPSPLFYSGSWNTPLFHILESHKKKYRVNEIFEGYYHHISKAYQFSIQQLNIKKSSAENIRDLTPEKVQAYVSAHVNIVKDLHDFSKAKGFSYINFLQPARFYHQGDSLYHGVTKSPINNYLSKIYFGIEVQLKQFPFHVSLTGLDHSKLNFSDECHPDLNGYKYMAEALAPYLIDQVSQISRPVKSDVGSK